MTIDPQELVNELYPLAYDLVEEYDFRIVEAKPVSAQYIEARAEFALRVLFDIATIPTAPGRD
jgi:hypothetical protein